MQTSVSLKSVQSPSIADISLSQASGCHVCEPRGGCLSEQLLKNDSLHQQLQQTKRIYRKGEHIFHAAELSEAFFVVKSGSVKSYFISEDGEEQVLGFYLPGDVFGLDLSQDLKRASINIRL